MYAGNTVQINATVSAANLDIVGDADFTLGGGAASDGTGTITFGAGGSLTAGNISLSAGDVLTLGDVVATGTLDITTSGDDITQLGGTGITATGLTTIDVGTGAGIFLNGTANDFGSVSLVNVGANGVDVYDVNAITLSGSASDLDVRGTTITLGGGTYGQLDAHASVSVGQSQAVTVTNATNIYATAANVDTTLNLAGNDFGAVSLFESGVGSTHRDVTFDDGIGNMNIGSTAGATSLTASSLGALDVRGGTYGTLTATGDTITQASPSPLATMT